MDAAEEVAIINLVLPEMNQMLTAWIVPGHPFFERVIAQPGATQDDVVRLAVLALQRLAFAIEEANPPNQSAANRASSGINVEFGAPDPASQDQALDDLHDLIRARLANDDFGGIVAADTIRSLLRDRSLQVVACFVEAAVNTATAAGCVAVRDGAADADEVNRRAANLLSEVIATLRPPP